MQSLSTLALEAASRIMYRFQYKEDEQYNNNCKCISQQLLWVKMHAMLSAESMIVIEFQFARLNIFCNKEISEIANTDYIH